MIERESASLTQTHVNSRVLRHTHASVLLRAGVDIKSVAARLGHGWASFTLDTYTHVIDDEDFEWRRDLRLHGGSVLDAYLASRHGQETDAARERCDFG